MTTTASARLTLILNSVQQLRPMPTNISRVLRALEDPLASAGIISDLIGLDQALAALLLQCANSAAMGYGSTCSSIDDAVMRLGFKRVRTIILGAGAAGPLNSRLNGYHIGAGKLWEHSIAAATAAGWLAKAIHYSEPEEAYVAGLLHDMGKLLLDQYVNTDYNKLIDNMKRRNLQLWQVEEQLFGIDHAGVGGLMADKWQFPAHLADAIRYHHAPSLARTKQELAALVNIANSFTPSIMNDMVDLDKRTIHPETPRILKLSDEKIAHLQTEFNESLKFGQSNTL